MFIVSPQKAWELLEHTPATEPIPMVVLEAKAAEYLMKRRIGSSAVNRADLVVSKTGDILKKLTEQHEPGMERESHQLLVRVNKDNCQAYYRGKQISLPRTYADRQFLRTITANEFILSDPDSAEVVLSFPLPMVALRVHQLPEGPHIAPCKYSLVRKVFYRDTSNLIPPSKSR